MMWVYRIASNSFLFDSINLHQQINPVVSREDILIKMAFPEEELQEITAFQIEKKRRN